MGIQFISGGPAHEQSPRSHGTRWKIDLLRSYYWTPRHRVVGVGAFFSETCEEESRSGTELDRRRRHEVALPQPKGPKHCMYKAYLDLYCHCIGYIYASPNGVSG